MKSSLAIVILLLIFTAPMAVFSQTKFHALTNAYVSFVQIDRKSYTWISSLNGINRYDGEKVKHYWPNKRDPKSIQEGLVQSNFYEDINDDLWFTTINYLHRYNRSTDDFDHFRIYSDSSSSYRVLDFLSNSELVVQIEDQLFSFNIQNEKWKLLFSGFEGVYAEITKDSKGFPKSIYSVRWAHGLGVLRLNFDKTGEPSTMDTLFRDVTAFAIKSCNGSLWIGHLKGVIQLEKDGSYKNYPSPNSQTITSLEFIWNKKALLIVAGGELYSFDCKNLNYTFISISSQHSFKKAFSISDNILLTWNEEQGLLKYNLTQNHLWNLETVSGGSIDYIVNSNIHNEEIFLGQFNGSVFELDAEHNMLEIDKSGNNMRPLYTENSLEFVNNESILHWDNLHSSFTEKIKHRMINEGAVKIDNGYLVFGNQGVQHIDLDGQVLQTQFESDNMTRPFVHNKRIYVYANDGATELVYVNNNFIKKHTYVIDDVISQFNLLNDSTFYVGTSQGVRVYNTNTNKQIEHILPNLYVQSFFKDSNQNLWLATRNGLYKRNVNGQLTHYNEKSGLPAQIFSENCVTSTADGTLYWGTNKGVLYFHPDSIKEEAYNPPMYLTSLKVHGHEWANDTINVEMISGVELKHNENTLTFEITAVDYDQYNHPQFRLFLKGHDVDTVDLGEQRTITYPNLAPGEYTFLYSACKLSGTCRSAFNSFDVNIHPPYWKTWWFRSALFLLGLGVILGGIRLYIRNRLREQQFVFEKQELTLKNELQLQQERNRIADELHDELGGKLSSIKFAGKKVQKANSLEEVKSINKRVSEISTELIDSMRSIIWAMDTHNDNLSSLLANIRQYASTLAHDNDIKLSLEFPGEQINPVVKGQIRHHLYLAIKEVLNNVLKHSEANQISIQVNCSAKLLEFIIHENGQGFDPANIKSSGRGLKNLNKRMDVLNGTVTMTNEQGMTTHFSVPL